MLIPMNTMQRRVSLPIKMRYSSKSLLLLVLSFQIACDQRRADIHSLSSNVTVPQAQISASVKGDDIEVKVTLVNPGRSPFALLKWNLPGNGRLDGGLFAVTRDGKTIE